MYSSYFLHFPFPQQNMYQLYMQISGLHFVSRISSHSNSPVGKNLNFRQDIREQWPEGTGEWKTQAYSGGRVETCKNGPEPVKFLVFKMAFILWIDQCYYSTGWSKLK